MRCTECSLSKTATQEVEGTGPVNTDTPIMLIGEVPGEDEDKRGVPFVGIAGQQVLDPILKAVGLDRRKIWIFNVLRCRPQNNNIDSPEAKDGLGICPGLFLFPAIEELRPKIIVTLGAISSNLLLGSKRGTRLADLRGRPVEKSFGEHTCYVMPSYHPASLLPGRNPANYQILLEDMHRAVSWLNGAQVVIAEKYRTLKSRTMVDKFFDWMHNGEMNDFIYDVEAQVYDANSKRPNIYKDKILGISISWRAGHAVYLPLRTRPAFSYELESYWGEDQDYVVGRLKKALETNISKGGQNAKYDNMILECDLGIKVSGYSFDTMIASHLLDENRMSHALDEQVRIHIPEKSGWKGMAQKGDMASLSLDTIAQYCCLDADLELRLRDIYAERLCKYPQFEHLFYHHCIPYQRTLQRMELTGAPVDVSAVIKLKADLEAEITKAEIRMRKVFGSTVNVDSPTDVYLALKQNGVDVTALEETDDDDVPILDAKGNPKISTKKAMLGSLSQSSGLVQLIMNTRVLQKMLSTYVIPIERFQINNRIHGSFKITGTKTGRISSSEPNLQNIPRGGELDNISHVWGKRVKSVYCAQAGWKLIQGDFSQMEVGVLADYSRDAALVAACSTEDVHFAAACSLFGLDFKEAYSRFLRGDPYLASRRQMIKSIVFGLIYGSSDDSLAKSYGLDVSVFKDFRAKFFQRFGGVEKFIGNTHQQIDANKEVISKFGRHRRIPYAGQKDKLGRAHRQAVNSLIQGTAADICAQAIYRLEDELIKYKYRARPVLTVHDSIVTEVPDEEVNEVCALQREIMLMKPLPDFSVSLRVDIEVGERWSELKKVGV